MRDYLVKFPTQEEAAAALKSYLLQGIAATPVTIWIANPLGNHLDEEQRPVIGRTAAPGYWIGLANMDPLQRHTNTVVELLRPATPTYWQRCILWAATNDFANIIAVDGTFAGSAYIFGASVP